MTTKREHSPGLISTPHNGQLLSIGLSPDCFVRDSRREHPYYIHNTNELAYDYRFEEIDAILLWFFQDQNDTRRLDAGAFLMQRALNHYQDPDTSFDSIKSDLEAAKLHYMKLFGSITA